MEIIKFQLILLWLHAHVKKFPVEMLKEIAEFATGRVKNCDNSDCDQIICILSDDQLKFPRFNYNHDYSNILGYKYCQISEKYYCHDCMDITTTCQLSDACSALIIPSSTTDKCAKCKIQIHDNCFKVESCSDCGKRFCWRCQGVKEDLAYQGFWFTHAYCEECMRQK